MSGFNVHSLVLEIPISRLKQGTEPVLGVWASTTRNGDQVSRLGMPLVNEVVIPLALKDAFNTLLPSQDLGVYTDGLGEDVGALLQKSVEDPEVGRLLCSLYGVPLPGDANDNCSSEVNVEVPRSGRGDIFDIFLTGMVTAKPFTIQTKNGPVTLPAGFNVNRPAGVQPAEMIRINTNIKGDLCSPTPSRLGVLGGDACGFPNGRRLTDDIVEIELLAVAGAAYQVLDGRDASFSFNPALIGVLDRRRRLQRPALPEDVPVLRPGAVRPDALPPEPDGSAADSLLSGQVPRSTAVPDGAALCATARPHVRSLAQLRAPCP